MYENPDGSLAHAEHRLESGIQMSFVGIGGPAEWPGLLELATRPIDPAAPA